jgi:hypothetical protein
VVHAPGLAAAAVLLAAVVVVVAFATHGVMATRRDVLSVAWKRSPFFNINLPGRKGSARFRKKRERADAGGFQRVPPQTEEVVAD